MEVIAGIDIGGTKCAVSFIHMNGDEVEFLSKEKRPTNEPHPDEMVQSRSLIHISEPTRPY